MTNPPYGDPSIRKQIKRNDLDATRLDNLWLSRVNGHELWLCEQTHNYRWCYRHQSGNEFGHYLWGGYIAVVKFIMVHTCVICGRWGCCLHGRHLTYIITHRFIALCVWNYIRYVTINLVTLRIHVRKSRQCFMQILASNRKYSNIISHNINKYYYVHENGDTVYNILI